MTSPSGTASILMDNEMNVTKRNGDLEIVSFDKILQRIKRIGQEVGIKVNYTALAMKVIDQLYDGISTTKIDELTAEQCASMASIHYDYNTLAGRIVVSNHQKNTCENFNEVMEALYQYRDVHGNHAPLVSENLIEVVRLFWESLNFICDYSRDYLIDYFGFKTLDRAYLMKINGKSVERPQHMWLRVAIGIHGHDMKKIVETYDLMSQKYFTHATPTLFNAGTPKPQLSSCFLLAMENDSIDGIYNTLKDCALISKHAGGIGLHIHNIRATGSHIRGTNGTSNGIVPMLKVFNNTAKYVDQCVLPETIIYTTDGPMCMNECISGVTQVFNTMGEAEVIENVLEHVYEGDMLAIDLDNCSKTLYITPEHPVYIGGEWIDAKDIRIGDYIGSVIPKYEKDIDYITADDCYIYGVLLRYGQITECGYEVHSVPPSEIYILKLYLLNRNVKLIEHYDTNSLYWEPAIHLPFRYSDIYNHFGLKQINPRWLHLPLFKIKKLIAGLFSTDTMSFDMMRDFTSIQYLCLRMGQIVDKNNIFNRIKLLQTDSLPKVITQEVTKIHSITHTGIVYDLQMKRVHNYLLESGNVHNGGGRRNGSFAIYLEPWHADIEAFLQLRKNHGDEELKARDLFYALWIPDLFMERVKANGIWTLMCPDECPGLADVYDADFVSLYEGYEAANKGKETVNARDLWFKMLDAQMETGMPYILYKDACNRKSNQKNVGTIKSSNLCVAPETLILTDKGELEIRSLEGHTVNVWNGQEFSEVTIRKTGENQSLIKVDMADGTFLECTPYHKFWLECDGFEMEVRAIDLKPGDATLSYKMADGSYVPLKIVVSVIDDGRIDDTYCFSEPKRHMGVFNGILTGQCSEVVQYSDPTETAVCNLASIGLPSFIVDGLFDYEKLHSVAKVVTKNLNRIIDINFYPTEKTRKSNLRHRPIGIGVQGLADVFMTLGFPFLSDEAKTMNKHIFETIYHGALEASCELAKLEGPYETFAGSPASQGQLQFDLWNIVHDSNRYDWSALKTEIQQIGLRNSLLLAPMPTASTSQILGFNECIEPITSNIYSRRTLAGEFIQANRYMMADLMAIGLWNDKIKNNIIANHGSIQQIESIPHDIKDKYKTVWEMPMRGLIDMAADRGAYICQSQSLNLWIEDPTYSTLTAMHFYSWQKGLKTGIYYLRRRGKHQAQQFTIEPEKATISGNHDDDICEMCSA